MKAMVLREQRTPLTLADLPTPVPADDQILARVRACGVCRTDLHIIDGDLKDPALPLVPGHEVVGEVVETGARVTRYARGDRVGIPWLGSTCESCDFCRSGAENLCDRPVFTGYHVNGGYAEFIVADARYCFPMPDRLGDTEAAPLMCAGLIGFRSYRLAGGARRLGLYGFGAAAHIISQVAVADGREVFAFTRPGDRLGQRFALRMRAHWAGGSDEKPPAELDAAIIFAPVGTLVPVALAAVRKGGTVICAGIHMSEIPAFPYDLLWGERTVRSVANLTREDGEQFFARLREVNVSTEVSRYPLDRANDALDDLRGGRLNGAAVLVP